MKKNLYVDCFGEYCFAALTEGDKIVELHIDSGVKSDISGNVYKGRVVNVLNGMQAAFVNFNQEKNGYLFAGDIPDGLQVTNTLSLNVKVGDEVMVQVSKSPIGTKGARVTMNVSFVGKYLIYLPNTPFFGVSRRIIDEAERQALIETAKKLSPIGGLIMRTRSKNATFKQLKKEAKYLREVYLSTTEAYKNADVGDIVYRSADLHMRLTRDFDIDEIDKIYAGNQESYEKIELLLKTINHKKKLVRYTGEREMFSYFGLEKEIHKLISNKVELESGAYLCIDKTEALTAIDVNTGKFIGENNLEETVFSTNILAAREIARQVRLRNIGGIVVVDFIDMQSEEHRNAVIAELEKELQKDKTKCNVVGMSALGLVQFTRKKEKKDNLSLITKQCPYCKGSGNIMSDRYLAYRIKSAIKDLFADGYENAIIELNAGLFASITSGRYFSEEIKTIWREKRIYMIPHKTYHEEYFTVRGDNNTVLTLPPTAKLLY